MYDLNVLTSSVNPKGLFSFSNLDLYVNCLNKYFNHITASQGLVHLSTNACTLGLWFYNQSTANDGGINLNFFVSL